MSGVRNKVLIVAVGTCVLAWSSPASAYRPFVSTDAAVAEPKEIEVELGYFTLDRTKDENTFIIPRTVLNYGLFKNWEGVAEFAIHRAPDATLDVIDPALSLKGVLKEGVLQEKDGFGLAVEASALLPSTEKGQDRFGFEAIGILSDKLGPFTFHLNAGLGIERSTGDLVGIWGLIGELPVASGVRLVGEVNGEKPRREDQRDSALLGVIWQPWSEKNLWLDAGIRRSFTGAADWQFTLGITFSFAVSSAATNPAPTGDLFREIRPISGIR
jgi:hypothetical protein